MTEYKTSMYTVMTDASAECGNKKIVFNTETGAVMLIDANRISDLASLRDTATTPEDLKRLVSWRFIVPDDMHEVAVQEAAFSLAQSDPSALSLCIAPTYACNLRCPYCYEKDKDSDIKVMSHKVQDGIMNLVKTVYETSPFTRLEVQWYGGEPLLGARVIESLSQRLMAFCREYDLAYSADIITNATLIDDVAAKMLAASGITSALVTIDGPRKIMNYRRPTANGTDSFDAVLRGMKHLRDAGVRVLPFMNIDKVNDRRFEETAVIVREATGLTLKRTKLNDYSRRFGCDGFCAPSFDLYDHKEYAKLECERFNGEFHTPYEYSALMSTAPLFCKGQSGRYFVIDANGDVYRCDGYMGDPDKKIFNLDDIPSDEKIFAADPYPFDNKMCTSCAILPICMGTCKWERESCLDYPCHPLKHTLDDYLRGWVDSMSEEERELLTHS